MPRLGSISAVVGSELPIPCGLGLLMCYMCVMTHTSDLSTQEAEAGRSLEFKASLSYTASSRSARAITERPCLKNKQASPRNENACDFLGMFGWN